jgi:hypothetical protein
MAKTLVGWVLAKPAMLLSDLGSHTWMKTGSICTCFGCTLATIPFDLAVQQCNRLHSKGIHLSAVASKIFGHSRLLNSDWGLRQVSVHLISCSTCKAVHARPEGPSSASAYEDLAAIGCVDHDNDEGMIFSINNIGASRLKPWDKDNTKESPLQEDKIPGLEAQVYCYHSKP